MGIKQRLCPDDGQVSGLLMHINHHRCLFNVGVEQRSMWRADKHRRGDRSAGSITATSQQRQLAELRAEVGWLAAGSSSVQQAALRDVDTAYANFFCGQVPVSAF